MTQSLSDWDEIRSDTGEILGRFQFKRGQVTVLYPGGRSRTEAEQVNVDGQVGRMLKEGPPQ